MSQQVVQQQAQAPVQYTAANDPVGEGRRTVSHGSE